MPNTTGLVNNLLVPENARADRYDQHVVKVDQVINGNHRFFARFARNKRTEVNDYAAFPPEASPWYQHGRMNVGLRRRGHVGAQPVARAQLARRLHPPRLLHRDARRQLRSDDARLPVELHLAARAPDVPADPVGRLHAPSGARSAATTAASSPSATRGRGPRCSARPPATTRSSSAASSARWSTTSRTRRRRRGASPSTARSPSATRWRAAVDAGELGRVAAARLSGRRVDDDGAERVADLPAAPLPRELLRPVRAGRLADQLAADAERRPPLGLRVAGRRGPEPAEHRLRHDVAEHVPGARALADAAGCCSRATTSACPSRRISTTSSPASARPSGSTTRPCCAAATRWRICRRSTTATTTGSASPPRWWRRPMAASRRSGRLSNPYPGRARPAGRQLAGALDAGRPRLHLLGSGADHSLRAPVLGRRAA